MKTEYTIGVFGIIFDERGRVLLCHRTDYDLWNLPGGGLEPQESITDGVEREVKEETGLDVEVGRLVGVYTKTDRNDIAFAFICKITSGKLTLNDEADRIEYFSVDKLPSNLIPRQVERIIDAQNNVSEIVFKVQIGGSAQELIKDARL